MGTNECSQPASKSSWDSQDFGDISMVLKMANFRKSTGPRWVKKGGVKLWADYLGLLESIKTTSMENVSTGVLDKNKEHYSRCKDKAQKSCDLSRHIQLHMSKYKQKWRFTIHYRVSHNQVYHKSHCHVIRPFLSRNTKYDLIFHWNLIIIHPGT